MELTLPVQGMLTRMSTLLRTRSDQPLTRITLDEPLKSRFARLDAPVEVCDEYGRVIGRYFPEPDPSECEPHSPQVSVEELRRRRQSHEWYSTDEVLAHLEST